MPRRISPFLAVTVVLLGCAGFAAYRSGWIPVEFGGAPTGTIVDSSLSSSGLDQPPEFEADDSASHDIRGVPRELLPNQTEPLLPDEPLDSNARRVFRDQAERGRAHQQAGPGGSRRRTRGPGGDGPSVGLWLVWRGPEVRVRHPPQIMDIGARR